MYTYVYVCVVVSWHDMDPYTCTWSDVHVYYVHDLCMTCRASGTSLLQTPLGPHEVSWLKKEVSLFQRLFSTHLYVYVGGTTGSVLIRGVSLIRRSLVERFHCIEDLLRIPPTHVYIWSQLCTVYVYVYDVEKCVNYHMVRNFRQEKNCLLPPPCSHAQANFYSASFFAPC